MKFEVYLKQELAKPVSDHYTPEGNSQRAIVTRGLLREILWQYKALPRRVAQSWCDFEGLDTPIGWFIQWLLFLPLFPVLPAFWGLHSHRSALAEYRREYENDKRLKQSVNQRKSGD